MFATNNVLQGQGHLQSQGQMVASSNNPVQGNHPNPAHFGSVDSNPMNQNRTLIPSSSNCQPQIMMTSVTTGKVLNPNHVQTTAKETSSSMEAKMVVGSYEEKEHQFDLQQQQTSSLGAAQNLSSVPSKDIPLFAATGENNCLLLFLYFVC